MATKSAARRTTRKSKPQRKRAPTATAEVFVAAFYALPQKEQMLVLGRLVEDNDLREEMQDYIHLVEREDEPSRPFEEFLAEHGL